MARNALLVYANTPPWSDEPGTRDNWLWSARFPGALLDQVADWGEQYEEYRAVVNPKLNMVAPMTARLVQLNRRLEAPQDVQSYAYGTEYTVRGDTARSRVAVLVAAQPQEPFRPEHLRVRQCSCTIGPTP